jgi:hypothetical protein
MVIETAKGNDMTNEEFNKIDRHSNGDIKNDLDMLYITMTDAQKRQLTGDDKSRVDDYEEEMRVMMSGLEAEFA